MGPKDMGPRRTPNQELMPAPEGTPAQPPSHDLKWWQRLRLRMYDLGWSKADLARRSGVAYDSINKYLRGVVDNPRGDILDQLSRAVGRDTRWLLFGDLTKAAQSLPPRMRGLTPPATVPSLGQPGLAASGEIDHGRRMNPANPTEPHGTAGGMMVDLDRSMITTDTVTPAPPANESLDLGPAAGESSSHGASDSLADDANHPPRLLDLVRPNSHARLANKIGLLRWDELPRYSDLEERSIVGLKTRFAIVYPSPENVSSDRDAFLKRRYFSVPVPDDSMTPNFLPGDLIICQIGVPLQPNDYCIASLRSDNSYYVRRYDINLQGGSKKGMAGENALLKPLNADYRDIVVTYKNPALILGKIVKLVRDFERNSQ